MARTYSDIEIFSSKLDWAMPFQRTGKFPLDRTDLFISYADAVKYAKGDLTDPDERGLCGTSYVGQIITVIDDSNNVTAYKINADRTLEAFTASASEAAYSIQPVTLTDEPNVKEAYQLVASIGGGEAAAVAGASVIKIYKDSSLQRVYLGSEGDTIDAATGVVTTVEIPEGQTAQHLCFVYLLADGTYSLVKVDLSAFLAATEFKDGLVVENGVVKAKVSADSEAFLSVTEGGIKLAGVQEAINTAVTELVDAEGDANLIDASAAGNKVTVEATTRLTDAVTAAESALQQSDVLQSVEANATGEAPVSAKAVYEVMCWSEESFTI